MARWKRSRKEYWEIETAAGNYILTLPANDSVFKKWYKIHDLLSKYNNPETLSMSMLPGESGFVLDVEKIKAFRDYITYGQTI